MQKKRELNIELLRIILIFFVLTYNVIIYKIDMLNITYGINIMYINNYNLSGFINSFIIVAANVFFLISGYFGIKQNLKKVLYFLLTLISYLLFFAILNSIIYSEPFNFGIIKNLFLNMDYYWFLYVYIFLVIISPLLNAIVESISEKQAKITTLIFLLFFCGLLFLRHYDAFSINNGYHFVLACFLYLIGAWIKKYNFFLYTKHHFLVYIIFSIINWDLFLVYLHLFKDGQKAMEMFYFNNPLVIISSICFFIFFSKLKIKDTPKKRKLITFLSTSTLGIYILQGIPFIESLSIRLLSFLIPVINKSDKKIFLYVFLFLIISYVVFIIIDKVLRLLLNKPLNKLAEILQSIIKKLFNFISLIVS